MLKVISPMRIGESEASLFSIRIQSIALRTAYPDKALVPTGVSASSKEYSGTGETGLALPQLHAVNILGEPTSASGRPTHGTTSQ
ncbi:hypothetical protein PCASD_20225 [Puccinia coronata f. sp. avenae]|uniref:Uncharacterized protein n=1 Tax=Puccinia coronata f. sp. avenae TaxID=200324 RepID=A0A2N5TVY8_9BASI|nr:hypothetical protein PCASD_20225 [Puccinia coronata f. sp. avenae]